MREDLTHVVFIVDRSGSMSHLTNDTIGGFNSFVETQKGEVGEAVLTTVLFDHEYEILHDNVNIQDVKALTSKEYYARGSTALLDAIGRTINTVGTKLDQMDDADKPSKVIVVITTDGQENASREFAQAKVKEMIEHQTEKYGWQFLFLGANIDAVSTAQSFGIAGEFSSNYAATGIGTANLYNTVGATVSQFRSSGLVSGDWNKDIDK